MARRLQLRRLLLIGLLLGAAFGGLCYRLVDLQVLRHEVLSARSQVDTRQKLLLQPQRGNILDIRGNLLATSLRACTVAANPSLIGNRQVEVARTIAPLLEMTEAQLLQRFNSRLRQNERGEITNTVGMEVILKRKVPLDTMQKIKVVMNNLSFGGEEKNASSTERNFYRNLRQKAIYTSGPEDQLRVYPNQSLAAHVLGCLGSKTVKINDVSVEETVGREGIEARFNSTLAGVPGWKIIETGSRAREVVPMREQEVEARDGLSVALTIDSTIQQIVEAALAEGMEKIAPKSISGIVVRPRTGEILAMASLPTFDPNHLDRSTLDDQRNRIITDAPEPGSTFKIVVVSGALNDDIVRLTDIFDCERGHFWYGGKSLHDHESHGLLSVENIVAKSSNIGAAKIGIQMGQARLFEYITAFGFGRKTGIPLNGETKGILHPLSEWSKVSIAQIPMGQGIAVTRLQMMMAMCAIANHGWLMQPMLIDRFEDSRHKVVTKFAPQPVRQVITDATARLITKALKTAVSPEGTAAKAALEHYTVAGKTGTAQKAEHGTYAHGKYFSSFLGFFPADNPELCISVMLDEPDPKKGYFGGQTAAPIFKQIAERAASYLNIRPEEQDTNTVPNSITASIGTKP